jgi:hypothetical protein
MPSASSALLSDRVACSQRSGSPTAFSGRVERYAVTSLNPKRRRMCSAKFTVERISPSICSGVQKMCASSCVKPRTRSSPRRTPSFS